MSCHRRVFSNVFVWKARNATESIRKPILCNLKLSKAAQREDEGMIMKATHRFRHIKKQAWSEPTRDGDRKPKSTYSSKEVGTDVCEITVQRIGKSNTSNLPVASVGLSKTIGVMRPDGKWTNCLAEIVTSSNPRMIQVTQKRTSKRASLAFTQSVLLPPLKGSRMTPGEVVGSSTHASLNRSVKPEEAKAKLATRLKSTNLNKENASFRLYLNRSHDTAIPTSDLIHGSLTIKKLKDSIQFATSSPYVPGRSVSENEKLTELPASASSSAPPNPSGKRQGADAENSSANEPSVTTHEINGATGRFESSSELSNIKTESQSIDWKGGPEVIPDKVFSVEEEYYTHQKIVDWVLKVNACLFSPSSEFMRSSSPGKEQDTSIKIVYEGD